MIQVMVFIGLMLIQNIEIPVTINNQVFYCVIEDNFISTKPKEISISIPENKKIIHRVYLFIDKIKTHTFGVWIV